MFSILLFTVWLGLSLFEVLYYGDPVVETLLLNSLIINVGVGGLYGFVANAFCADMAAEYCGWPKGSPFQFEVAIASLALSALGFAAIWLRGNFWIAAIAAYSIFLLGSSYAHTREMIDNKNFTSGNAGPVFFTNVMNPIILMVLGLIFYLKA
jgi:hypothetical protein